MKIKELNESTTAGSIAPGTPAKVGKMQKRAGSLFKGKVTNKPFYEAEVNEEEIVEQDLILVPDQIIKKDKSFVPHKEDRRDHEVAMARSDLLATAKNAMRMYHLLKNRSEDQGLMGWQQSYITLAADYLNSVADSIEYDARTDEMTGGVLAGGMSNFEEGAAKEFEKYKLEMINRKGEVRATYGQNNRRYSLKNMLSDILYWLRLNPSKTFKFYINDKPVDWKELVAKQGVTEEQAPMFTPEEEQLDEKKDACYSKVKSRYKVWPSAYASGALSKCRKVGAANWGNKSKK